MTCALGLTVAYDHTWYLSHMPYDRQNPIKCNFSENFFKRKVKYAA